MWTLAGTNSATVGIGQQLSELEQRIDQRLTEMEQHNDQRWAEVRQQLQAAIQPLTVSKPSSVNSSTVNGILGRLEGGRRRDATLPDCCSIQLAPCGELLWPSSSVVASALINQVFHLVVLAKHKHSPTAPEQLSTSKEVPQFGKRCDVCLPFYLLHHGRMLCRACIQYVTYASIG